MIRLSVLDDVAWEGRPVPGERTHALLRALVGAGARGLGEQALVEEVWADDPPANPAKALQVVVSRARSATAPGAIERTAYGYRLALPPTDVDAWALRPEGLRLAAEGKYADALPLLERAEESGQSDDEVIAALLRAVADVHGVPAALERYETYRERLADRLGVDPSPALQALHSELLARDRPVRSGLRFDADALIGREADIAAATAMVRTARVVSIVGAGGLGKTRLAHVVGRQAEQPVVHFVELAGVTSPDGVPLEVADALGVRETVVTRGRPRREDVVGRIVDAVGTTPSLLILDNCEHVVGAVAELVSVLVARTPALTVLTTSRAPLGLAAERIYLLPELSTEDGVALFVERATAARPGVQLDPEAVRSLVTRLDGLPLAVELAAAKMRVMSVAEIERRLDNRFALLRGGSRDAPERHQTLIAVIDWSWNLLTEEQRVALRRLSVFRDGFSLDGATAVVGPDALDLVTALADQSLVTVQEGERVRFRLLETVREFGRMQLVDAGDDAEASERLREWAVELADAAGRRLFSRDQVATMAEVRVEEGNLLGVVRAALAAGDVATVIRIFTSLGGFWTIEGSHLKVVSLAQQVEDLVLPAPLVPGLEDALRTVLVFIITNRMIFSRQSTAEVAARLREIGPGDTDPITHANVRVVLALIGSEASGQVEELLQLTHDPDPVVSRVALMWSAAALENNGDLAGSRSSARRALALADPDEGPWTGALLTAQLASLALQAGDTTEAKEYAARALPLLEEIGAWDDLAQTRSMLALAAIRLGELDEAERILTAVDDDEASKSIFGGAVSQLAGHAELRLARGHTAAGLAAYREAVALLRDRGIPGQDMPIDYAPWVIFPESASIAAHCRVGRADDVRAERESMRETLVSLLGDDRDFLDYPIAGCGMFALAVWELTTGGSREAARRLLGYAVAFSFNRMLPSLDLEWAEDLLGEKTDEPRPAPDVRGEARELLLTL
ncbi:Predicted ATPase [Nocardioides terrae]|uniref:Predicted ATPase n=1 Tax=Nocardioides terrae TaxID=574651 RepID=A0A1I1M3R1_9ACTN|nr:BTAD domain-containing putative transcriptional regulator [Nocardioides terrae]SFC80011.1 Predicted ATPase [Nocardioides terrae]